MPTGTLRDWNDDRGYGFLTNDSKERGKDAFVHITAFRLAGINPVPGDAFAYALTEHNGRQVAAHLQRIWSPRAEVGYAS